MIWWRAYAALDTSAFKALETPMALAGMVDEQAQLGNFVVWLGSVDIPS